MVCLTVAEEKFLDAHAVFPDQQRETLHCFTEHQDSKSNYIFIVSCQFARQSSVRRFLNLETDLVNRANLHQVNPLGLNLKLMPVSESPLKKVTLVLVLSLAGCDPPFTSATD